MCARRASPPVSLVRVAVIAVVQVLLPLLDSALRTMNAHWGLSVTYRPPLKVAGQGGTARKVPPKAFVVLRAFIRTRLVRKHARTVRLVPTVPDSDQPVTLLALLAHSVPLEQPLQLHICAPKEPSAIPSDFNCNHSVAIALKDLTAQVQVSLLPLVNAQPATIVLRGLQVPPPKCAPLVTTVWLVLPFSPLARPGHLHTVLATLTAVFVHLALLESTVRMPVLRRHLQRTVQRVLCVCPALIPPLRTTG
mmetsp:Transcript_32872/g.64470  ORF Transcript_32872/g.64470 Transcript_32872/m.64470 type:complete len:250 (+) Transcript_32872:1117-1866(+)